MDPYFYDHVIALVVYILFFGPIIAMAIYAIKKIKTKIRDKKRHDAWKAAADIAAAEQSEENKDL